MWALFLWFYRGVTKGVLEIRRVALPLPLAIFFVLAIFYTFHSIDFVVSRNFLFFLTTYIVIFFLVAHVPSLKEVRWIALAIVVLGILTSVRGLYHYFWVFPELLDKFKTADALLPSTIPFREEVIERLEGGRIFSTFLLPSHFAAFLGVSIPVSVASVLTNKGWLRYLFGLAAALQVFALYLTKSFSGWLSLILACGCVAYLYLAYIKRVKGRYLAAAMGGLFLALLLVVAGLSLQRPDNPLASIKNNPMVLRALNWGTTVAMISDSPWLGKGLDTFGIIYPSYQRGGVNIVHHAHNTYLQLGVEMGIIGTIAFLWFACWWLWRTIRIFKETKDKKIRVLVGFLMAAGTAFFIHQAFDFEFYLPSATLAGFAVLALAVTARKQDKVYKIRVKKKRKLIITTAGFVGTIVASLLLIVLFYGRMHFQRAMSFLSTGSYFAEAAATEFQKAIRLDPCNSEYHQRYGVLLFQRLSQQQKGIAEVQEAIRLSPWRHYYYYDLGMLYLASGEEEKGLKMIKKASQLYPFEENYHQWLRAVYLKMGEKDLAAQEERWIDKIREGESG